MKRIAGVVIILGLLTACATARPMPATQVHDYFRCDPTTTLAAAEERLVMAGWPIASKGERYVQTDWQQMASTDGSAAAAFLGVGGRLLVRLSVREGSGALEWSAMRRSEMQKSNGLTGGPTTQRESGWDQITDRDVADAEVGRILERMHRDVCGTAFAWYADARR